MPVLKDLSGFIGIDVRPEFIQTRVNPRKREETLPDELIKECALFYKPVYENLAERFPHVKELWEGFQYLEY